MLMKKFTLAIVSMMFLLIGCSDDDVEVEVDPPPAPEEENEQQSNEQTTWTESPPHISIRGGSGQINAIRDTHCWGEEDGEPCSRIPAHPSETTMGSGASMVVNQGEQIDVAVNTDDHIPNQVTVTQFGMNDDEGVVVASFEDTWVDVFHAPEDGEGRHYYQIHTQWDEDPVGEAYYAFYLIVK